MFRSLSRLPASLPLFSTHAFFTSSPVAALQTNQHQQQYHDDNPSDTSRSLADAPTSSPDHITAMHASQEVSLPTRSAGLPATGLASSPTQNGASSQSDQFDVVATYHRLLDEDPDLTKPVAAVEALIDVLRHTPSSTAMETYEITGAQVQRLHAAVPNALPVEAGTSLFTNFLSMSMRQPAADPLSDPNGAASPLALDSFEKIRQHLLDNSQLFVQRAKEARDRIANRGCRLVGAGQVVLTAGGSRAVRALFLKAAERLRATESTSGLFPAGTNGTASNNSSSSPPSPFTVLYVCDDRSRDECESAIAILRQHGIRVIAIDPSAVAYALEAYNVASIFVGSEAVTHDGKLVSRIGTYQLALLASVSRPQRKFYVLAETHKFVRKLLLNNTDLDRIGIYQELEEQQQNDTPSSTPEVLEADALPSKRLPQRIPTPSKLLLDVKEQVDVTPPSLVTNIITETGIIQPSGSYRIVSN